MKRKYVLICGREHLSDDAEFHDRLIAFLRSLKLELIEEVTVSTVPQQEAYYVRGLKLVLRSLGLIRLVHKLLLRTNRFQSLVSVNLRLKHLRTVLASVDWELQDVYLIGRSAGAIVAAKLALEFPVQAVFALGYPFIHPVYGRQQYRVRHLTQLEKPMFIFQGVRDEYGVPSQLANIPLAAHIQVIPLDTDHSFVLDKKSWEAFTSQLSELLT